MLSQVEWGEYKIIDIFDVKNTQCILSRDVSPKANGIPYLCAGSENNAVSAYIDYDTKYLDQGNCIFIGGKTLVVTYQKDNFYSNDSHNLALYLKSTTNATRATYLFLASCVYQGLKHKYTWGDSISYKKIQADKIKLPTKNGEIDFDFMEKFVAELEAQRVAELEAYLTATGLKDYELTVAEQKALEDFANLQWATFNLEDLFGKSTRGKRLKSDDRIAGDLPFVTAGEADEGISAFISNKVEIFEANTTTIDMFGSAKYRNYKYGADDHVAVVHTEKLSKFAAIFTTAAIHKSSHAGQFDYSRNFYAKDADELNISLPVHNNEPDYLAMEILISAIQKLIIKDVVQYSDRKIAATKQCCDTNKGMRNGIQYI